MLGLHMNDNYHVHCESRTLCVQVLLLSMKVDGDKILGLYFGMKMKKKMIKTTTNRVGFQRDEVGLMDRQQTRKGHGCTGARVHADFVFSVPLVKLDLHLQPCNHQRPSFYLF